MDMQVEELDGGVTNVMLRGRLDTVGAGAIDLKFSAVAGSKRAIVVDLSGIDFLASLGIRVLVMGAKAVRNKGGKLVLLSPDENVPSCSIDRLPSQRSSRVEPGAHDRLRGRPLSFGSRFA
jgi:anti-sigma B factor antagonist